MVCTLYILMSFSWQKQCYTLHKEYGTVRKNLVVGCNMITAHHNTSYTSQYSCIVILCIMTGNYHNTATIKTPPKRLPFC